MISESSCNIVSWEGRERRSKGGGGSKEKTRGDYVGAGTPCRWTARNIQTIACLVLSVQFAGHSQKGCGILTCSLCEMQEGKGIERFELGSHGDTRPPFGRRGQVCTCLALELNPTPSKGGLPLFHCAKARELKSTSLLFPIFSLSHAHAHPLTHSTISAKVLSTNLHFALHLPPGPSWPRRRWPRR